MKLCNKCKETKVFSEFCKNKARKDGHQSYCKACMKQYNKQYRDNNKEYFTKWQNENKESIAIYQNQYRSENKEYFSTYQKLRNAAATPCVYRIKHKTSGEYYIGSTTHPINNRVCIHFHKTSSPRSPFSGEDRTNWEVTVLCYGTKTQVRELEKELQRTRVNKDVNCMNKRIG